MAYATLAELKAYLGITGTTDDMLLTDLLVRSQAIIDAATQRTFEATADSTRYLDAVEDVDGRVLWLDRVGDLAQITSITNGDGSSVASSEYVTEPRNQAPYYAIQLKASSSVAWTYSDSPENAIAITGRWAYSVTPPDDIVHACIRLAAYLYRQKDNATDLDRPVIAGNVTLLPAQLPADIQSLLAPYRRWH
ncbi:MAG: hypothetical protein KatS3mg051_2136 [Anaerolineae bacterium]|nr:MAG: hypothetical protein KatS3mg051_2136 [Anaerolineae bacterium]